MANRRTDEGRQIVVLLNRVGTNPRDDYEDRIGWDAEEL